MITSAPRRYRPLRLSRTTPEIAEVPTFWVAAGVVSIVAGVLPVGAGVLPVGGGVFPVGAGCFGLVWAKSGAAPRKKARITTSNFGEASRINLPARVRRQSRCAGQLEHASLLVARRYSI